MNRVPPTGPVIHLGTDSAINGSSTTMVCYSWHSVPGLQNLEPLQEMEMQMDPS